MFNISPSLLSAVAGKRIPASPAKCISQGRYQTWHDKNHHQHIFTSFNNSILYERNNILTDNLPSDGSLQWPARPLLSPPHICCDCATLWKLYDWDSLILLRINVPKQLVTIEATVAPTTDCHSATYNECQQPVRLAEEEKSIMN